MHNYSKLSIKFLTYIAELGKLITIIGYNPYLREWIKSQVEIFSQVDMRKLSDKIVDKIDERNERAISKKIKDGNLYAEKIYDIIDAKNFLHEVDCERNETFDSINNNPKFLSKFQENPNEEETSIVSTESQFCEYSPSVSFSFSQSSNSSFTNNNNEPNRSWWRYLLFVITVVPLVIISLIGHLIPQKPSFLEIMKKGKSFFFGPTETEKGAEKLTFQT